MTGTDSKATEFVVPFGAASDDAFAVSITPETTQLPAGDWAHSSLRVARLEPGGSVRVDTGADETMVLSLGGAADVEVEIDGRSQAFELKGRADVWSGPSDVVYAPLGAHLTLTSRAGGTFALAGARAHHQLPSAYLPAESVPVELRGAGTASRQVHNFGTPGVLDADRLIACEVLTPGGNWSSYPPHKHDTEREGETRLEEIYYFEVAASPDGAPGAAYQRVYGHDDAQIDVLTEVRSGDVVLIPHGWHGPSMAAPGYDLYYLNVMAGPGAERAWRICDDPQYAWVRQQWADQAIDARLPMGGTTQEGGA